VGKCLSGARRIRRRPFNYLLLSVLFGFTMQFSDAQQLFRISRFVGCPNRPVPSLVRVDTLCKYHLQHADAWIVVVIVLVMMMMMIKIKKNKSDNNDNRLYGFLGHMSHTNSTLHVT
jgi:hypothetical protein